MWSMSLPWPSLYPARAFGNKYGAFDIDSMPPATKRSFDPARRRSWANSTDFIPEPQTLLIVVHGTPSGRPALMDACRAGACPSPAGRTHPISSSWTDAGSIFARSTAAWMAAPPSSGAVNDANSPWKPPIGVRAADMITTGSFVFVMPISSFCRHADCAIETNDFAVQIWTADDVFHKVRELRWPSHTLWKGHGVPKRLLHFCRHTQ